MFIAYTKKSKRIIAHTPNEDIFKVFMETHDSENIVYEKLPKKVSKKLLASNTNSIIDIEIDAISNGYTDLFFTTNEIFMWADEILQEIVNDITQYSRVMKDSLKVLTLDDEEKMIIKTFDEMVLHRVISEYMYSISNMFESSSGIWETISIESIIKGFILPDIEQYLSTRR